MTYLSLSDAEIKQKVADDKRRDTIQLRASVAGIFLGVAALYAGGIALAEIFPPNSGKGVIPNVQTVEVSREP